MELSQETSIKPKLKWLEEVFGLDGAVCGKAVLKAPSLLSIDSKRTVEKMIVFLREELHFGEPALRGLFERSPPLFVRDVDSYRSNVDWILREYLGLDFLGVRQMVRTYPEAFFYKAKRDRDHLDWLEDRFDLCRMRAVMEVTKRPMLLHCRVGDIEKKTRVVATATRPFR